MTLIPTSHWVYLVNEIKYNVFNSTCYECQVMNFAFFSIRQAVHYVYRRFQFIMCNE